MELRWQEGVVLEEKLRPLAGGAGVLVVVVDVLRWCGGGKEGLVVWTLIGGDRVGVVGIAGHWGRREVGRVRVREGGERRGRERVVLVLGRSSGEDCATGVAWRGGQGEGGGGEGRGGEGRERGRIELKTHTSGSCYALGRVLLYEGKVSYMGIEL